MRVTTLVGDEPTARLRDRVMPPDEYELTVGLRDGNVLALIGTREELARLAVAIDGCLFPTPDPWPDVTRSLTGCDGTDMP